MQAPHPVVFCLKRGRGDVVVSHPSPAHCCREMPPFGKEKNRPRVYPAQAGPRLWEKDRDGRKELRRKESFPKPSTQMKGFGKNGKEGLPVLRAYRYLVVLNQSTKFSQKRMRIWATSARVAPLVGLRVVLLVPLMRPSALAHCMAVSAQELTPPTSV